MDLGYKGNGILILSIDGTSRLKSKILFGYTMRMANRAQRGDMGILASLFS